MLTRRYRNDFIRWKETDDIDVEKSLKIVRDLYSAATLYPDHNILIDLRETRVTYADMGGLLKIALEFTRLMPSFKEKIATLVPDDADRVAIAEKFQASMRVYSYEYKYFTEYEDAIEWLSGGEPH